MLDAPQDPAVSNPPVEGFKPAFGPGDIIRMSATQSVPQPSRQLTPMAKLIDVSKCIGCKACQAACIEWNDTQPAIEENRGDYTNPHDLTADMFTLMRFAEWENPDTSELEWLIRKDGCMHCADPGCLEACPAPGAIVQYSNGIVDFNHDACIGCGYCLKGCPFDIPRYSEKNHNKAYKCTLCSDRMAVGQGPACAKACPTQAIVFGTKDEMKTHAETRIADLKSRGYENAGLYDPEGVGGTHVMYVLHHADKPHIYNGLPDHPQISPVVSAWKGVTKSVGLAAMGLTAAAAILHGLFARPNRVSAEDERNGEAVAKGGTTAGGA